LASQLDCLITLHRAFLIGERCLSSSYIGQWPTEKGKVYWDNNKIELAESAIGENRDVRFEKSKPGKNYF